MKSEILEVDSLRWRTARRSAANGACVEVAPAAGIPLEHAVRQDRRQPAQVAGAGLDRVAGDRARRQQALQVHQVTLAHSTCSRVELLLHGRL